MNLVFVTKKYGHMITGIHQRQTDMIRERRFVHSIYTFRCLQEERDSLMRKPRYCNEMKIHGYLQASLVNVHSWYMVVVGNYYIIIL